MANSTRLYDLMLILSTAVEEERRAKLISDVESQIAAGGGTVQRRDEWHARPLTFEISHQGEGEYHLIQFTGPTAVLDSLSHSLRIDDAVLRFRIIKVTPGTPPPPDSPPPVLTGAGSGTATGQAPAEAPIER